MENQSQNKNSFSHLAQQLRTSQKDKAIHHVRTNPAKKIGVKPVLQNLPLNPSPPATSLPTEKPEKNENCLSPEQLFAMAKMGYTQWEYGKLERARTIFQTLVLQKPQEPWFHCALGSIYQHQKQFAPALQQYNLVLQLDPNDLASRVNRGEIYLKIGKREQGCADLIFAVNTDVTGRHPSALRARSLLTAMGI